MDPRALPHQPPLRLVDEVLELEAGASCLAAYAVPPDAFWVEAHFPGDPIMPGVLVAEAMAQAAGLAYLSAHPEGDGRPLIMVGWDKLRFRGPVRPGDALVLEARALRRTRILWKFACSARVGERPVADGELLATVG